MAVPSVTSTGGAAAPASTAPAAATGGARAGISGTQANVPASTTFHDDLTKATERLKPVKGHAYSKVESGAREGMYVNTSHNKRDGEAFRLENHDGRRWHVYGEGADRVVIAFAKPGATPAAAKTTTPAATTPAATTVPAATTTPAVTTPTATTTVPAATTTPDTPSIVNYLPAAGGSEAPAEATAGGTEPDDS